MPTQRLEFFDTLPNFNSVIAAASLTGPHLTPERMPRPHTMLLVVTRRCNSRCQMCYIWKEKDSSMLSLEQYRHIFRESYPSVRMLTLTGGEATLRADLPEIWAIARQSLPQLEQGSLATHGLNTQRTLDHVKAIMEEIEANPGKMNHFTVQISLDGIGEMHDHIRGIPGFFEKVQRTIAGLIELEQRYPILQHQISMVVLPDNVGEVMKVRDFAKERNLTVYFSPAVLSGPYFNNLEHADTLGFTKGTPKAQIARDAFISLSHDQANPLRFYYDDMVKMIDGAKRSRTCLMGFFSCVIEHTGEVYPCPMWEYESFGNLLTNSFDEVWFSEQAQAARHKLRLTGCPDCTSICYAGPIGISEMLQNKAEQVKARIQQLTSRT
jgi:radical SAM protein with 4Fe4S-binding SPASM domain